jgi:transposase
VPAQTARVARAAFPHGNRYVRLRDELGTVYEDGQFAELFPTRGQPAETPWRLALITVFQFAEQLSDRQAADAVRARIDWKYALSLELTDPGFDASVLCEFRCRLLAGSAAELLLELLLKRCEQLGLLQAHGRQRTDSTHVLAAVRGLTRLDLVRETMRQVLDSLAVVAPDWLRTHSQPAWPERYRPRFPDRLPTGKAAQQDLAEQIGRDGMAVLDAVSDPEAPDWLRQLPAVAVLRWVWLQNYLPTPIGVRFRTEEDGLPPASRFVSSPYDSAARYARKSTTSWTGYKVHLTETCEDTSPHLITHVATTIAPTADAAVTAEIHQALREVDRLPTTHLVDTGYLDAELIVSSREDFGVDLFGPTRPDVKWQAKAGNGFAAEHFAIDWEQQRATCPEGHASVSWTPAIDRRHNRVIKIKFSGKDCRLCPSRLQCTRSQKRYPRRTITIRPQDQYTALQARRAAERTAEYTAEYARRAGVEGTISQAVRTCGMRRSRYIGLAKTHLGHVFTATAVNVVRIAEWLAGARPAQTRQSAFVVLMASAP